MRVALLNEVIAAFLPRRAPPLKAVPQAISTQELCAALLTSRGEVSGVALAGMILDRYATSGTDEKLAFFQMLAGRFEIDAAACVEAAAHYQAERSASALAALQVATEPPRQELLRRLNLAPGGTQALVQMRSDLLGLLATNRPLEAVDADFRHLFASWFNRGFLELKAMNWSSSARHLEKIIAYEAVHEIRSWEELRQRVEPADRLCFAFFHPSMPDEPLIVLEVALARDIPNSVQALLDGDRDQLYPDDARVACFYSISNCQDGLRGVSFGSFLIKQVAQDLAARMPQLRTFVTLSPMPGFNLWLDGQSIARPALTQPNGGSVADPERQRYLWLAARYLAEARRSPGQPLDAVARFHLRNGAILHAVHWAADTGATRFRQSGGIMVNYLYDLDAVEKNHEAFVGSGTVAMSPAIRAMLAERKDELGQPPL